MVLQALSEAAEAETSRLEDEIDDVSTRLDAAEAELTAARVMAQALKACANTMSRLLTYELCICCESALQRRCHWSYIFTPLALVWHMPDAHGRTGLIWQAT